jgi:hypothetical protein
MARDAFPSQPQELGADAHVEPVPLTPLPFQTLWRSIKAIIPLRLFVFSLGGKVTLPPSILCQRAISVGVCATL